MLQQVSTHAEILPRSIAPQNLDLPTSKRPQRIGLFSRGIIVEDGARLHNHATNCTISFVLHVGLMALLALLSFLTPVAVRLHPWTRTMLIAPLPPSKVATVNRRRAAGTAKNVLSSLHLTAPVFVSREAREALNSSASSPKLDALRFDASAATFGTGDILGGIVNNAPVPLVSPVLPEGLRRLHMAEVTNSRPLRKLVLAYPALAKTAHIFGQVVIKAIIDETGKVIHVRAVSGPPLLYLTAVNAVSNERFDPLLVDGEPTKCDLTVQVSFELNDDH